ncbi:MAG: Hpt domain-containing protein [Planctomycetota bacterium]
MSLHNALNSIAELVMVAEAENEDDLLELRDRLQRLKREAEDASARVSAGTIDRISETIALIDSFQDGSADLGGDEVLEKVGKLTSLLQQNEAGETDSNNEMSGEQGASQAGDDGESDVSGNDLPANVDEAILSEFLDSRSDTLLQVEELALSLETEADPDQVHETADQIKRLLHTIKGETGMLGLNGSQRLCHALESMFESAHRPDQLSDVLLQAKDWLHDAFEAYGRGELPAEEPDDILAEIDELLEDTDEDGEPDKTASGESPDEPAEAGPQQRPGEGDWSDPDEQDDDAVGERDTPEAVTDDPDMVMEFIEEALEHLEAADSQLLKLESNPENAEALDAVFRAFHTIKGLAGFFELEHVQTLAHRAENLLDAARDGTITLAEGRADAAFDSVDLLRTLIVDVKETLQSGTPLPHREEINDLLPAIAGILSGASAPAEESLEVDDPSKKLGEILLEQGIITEQDLEDALEKEPAEDGPPVLGELLVEAAEMSSREDLEALREQLKGGRWEKVGELLLQKEEVTPEDVEEALQGADTGSGKKKIGQKLVEKGAASGKDVARAVRGQKKSRNQTTKSSTKSGSRASDSTSTPSTNQVRESIRVDADRLDHLIETIGEMVIAQSMVQQSLSDVEISQSAGVQRKLDRLDKMTREMQEVGMSLRMVPVRATFRKMARLVRDLSRKSGKKIQFKMSGEHTELDKSLVDQIGDPLVHLIRNAVDHGIEDPGEREAKGKSPTGSIYLRAYHEGGNIYIQVEDDGQGLDRGAILDKARSRGLIDDGDEMEDEEVYGLIFEPGFSTNDEITDVSGRGVGMDVVKRNIEGMRGQVSVESEPGEGSTFTIRLPLTLAIINGMVTRIGEERYVIPTLSIQQSVRPSEGDISSVLGKGRMLDFQGGDIPLYHLGRLFHIDGAGTEWEKGLAVVVDCDGRQVGLFVDELLGQQQTVIKSLSGGLQKQPGLSGGAIMPDGKVALILDVPGLVRTAELNAEEQIDVAG